MSDARKRPAPTLRRVTFKTSRLAEFCGEKELTAHAAGGSPKRFCCAAHRTAFWSAARRWAERAVVSGFLSVDDIRNGVGKACTLLPGGDSPALAPLSQKSGAVAPAERPGEHVALPDDS
jgi:hypothetical protein